MLLYAWPLLPLYGIPFALNCYAILSLFSNAVGLLVLTNLTPNVKSAHVRQGLEIVCLFALGDD